MTEVVLYQNCNGWLEWRMDDRVMEAEKAESMVCDAEKGVQCKGCDAPTAAQGTGDSSEAAMF